MTLFWVRVPVLSVQRMSMEPRFSMESSFLMMTFLCDMSTAPLARQVVTSMGSISGVRPTAMEMAKSSASSQLFLVRPLMRKTAGTMTSMKRMRSHETLCTPLSKAVLVGACESSEDTSPSMVEVPVATTRHVAPPEETLLPMKTRFCVSVRLPSPELGSAVLLTGTLSPVSAPDSR